MSEPLQFPENHYQTLPHLRLSKRKYLALVADFLYLVKIKSGLSHFTLISHISEIQKVSVQMENSKNWGYLYLYILPRMGKRKDYLIRSRKKLVYSPEDWTQIPEFLRFMDFQSEPLPPKGVRLEEIQYAYQVTGPYRYFPSQDKIFRLFENPQFMEELKLIKFSVFAVLLVIFGAIGLFIVVIFGAIRLFTAIVVGSTDAKSVFWIMSGISALLIGFGYPKLAKYSRMKKEFSAKYDIKYYFK